jgi:hypothetical protein
MPILRASDGVRVRLPVGEALVVNASTGTVAVTSTDLDVAATINSGVQTFGPYTAEKVFDVRCTAKAVNYFVASISAGTVSGSRVLSDSDNGKVLECIATSTLTVPIGLKPGFRCTILASGTTSVAASGGALVNGATSTLTRAAASNPAFDIIARVSAVDSYLVTGS